ncbi:hypothetical protein ACYQR9_02745 [Methylobacterium sp. CM6241]
MRADEAVKKQLTARLKRLRRRAAEVAAEISMVEQMMADVEIRAIDPRLKLRSNSVSKLSVQSTVRRILKQNNAPLRAGDIFDLIRDADPSLKSSTFRSHLRRMVEAGYIIRNEARGYYSIAENSPQEAEVVHRPRRRSEILEWSHN